MSENTITAVQLLDMLRDTLEEEGQTEKATVVQEIIDLLTQRPKKNGSEK